jgi:hypothetical protein
LKIRSQNFLFIVWNIHTGLYFIYFI